MRYYLLLAALLSLCVSSAGAAGVEGKQVLYLGGTLAAPGENTLGSFDTTSEKGLIFAWGQSRLEIPYDKMTKFHYEEKLAHRLGALTTLAVVLVKHRHRRHILEITFKDEAGLPQTAVFEIPKTMPETLLPVLRTRCAQCTPPQMPVRYGSPQQLPPPRPPQSK